MSMQRGSTTSRIRRMSLLNDDRVRLLQAIDHLLQTRSFQIEDATSCSSTAPSNPCNMNPIPDPLSVTSQLPTVKVSIHPPSNALDTVRAPKNDTVSVSNVNPHHDNNEDDDDESHDHDLQIIMTDDGKYRFDDQSDFEGFEDGIIGMSMGEVSKLVPLEHAPLCKADSLHHYHSVHAAPSSNTNTPTAAGRGIGIGMRTGTGTDPDGDSKSIPFGPNFPIHPTLEVIQIHPEDLDETELDKMRRNPIHIARSTLSPPDTPSFIQISNRPKSSKSPNSNSRQSTPSIPVAIIPVDGNRSYRSYRTKSVHHNNNCNQNHSRNPSIPKISVVVTPSMKSPVISRDATPGHYYNYDYDGFVELQGISSASTTMRWNQNGSYHWKVQSNATESDANTNTNTNTNNNNNNTSTHRGIPVGPIPVLMNHAVMNQSAVDDSAVFLSGDSLPIPSVNPEEASISCRSNTITMEPLDVFSDDELDSKMNEMNPDDPHHPHHRRYRDRIRPLTRSTPNIHGNDDDDGVDTFTPPLLSLVQRGPHQSTEDEDGSDSDVYDERSQKYFNGSQQLMIDPVRDGRCYYSDSEGSYTSMFNALLNKHSRTLFMLQCTKSHLLSGYLRRYGIQSALDVPHGIYAVVLSYFDDSAMRFDIRIEDLFSNLKGSDHHNCSQNTKRTKLKGDLFTFDLNMDHQIEFVPTLIHQRCDELNHIELSLECQYLPIKIDRALVLINILCLCHEVKYRKMDIYNFGTDLLADSQSADEHNYNLLNRSGLKMVIPQREIENLDALQFAITATVLDIEYDANYDGFILRRDYNSRLTMSKEVEFEWTLSRRQWTSLTMQFKQRFYSAAFDCDYWCLSCYQLEGQLLIQLNLLRLPLDVQSVDFEALCVLSIGPNQIWSNRKAKGSGNGGGSGKGMDIEYNNSFKWTVSKSVIAPFMTTDHDTDAEFGGNVSISIRIQNVESKLKQRRDIYSLNSTMIGDQE